MGFLLSRAFVTAADVDEELGEQLARELEGQVFALSLRSRVGS